MKKLKLGFRFIIAIFMAIFIGTFSYNVQAASVIDEARQIIKDNYVESVPDSVLNAPTIPDIIKGLNDPYSEYFSNQEQQNFVNSIDNKLCGIGIYMEMVEEGVQVNSVVPSSPAEQSGIKAGDIITSADGNSLAGLDSNKASSYIKGDAGTSVKLVVKRGTQELNFTVVRKEISIPTVTGKILNGHTAYIDIVSFGEDTDELFTKVVQELRMQNPDNYIIDLRNNGGGYMDKALNIASNFIGSKPSITIESKNGDKVRYFVNKEATIDKPIIFLTNQYTASASEILSAAVKDYKKAFFVGTTTYGKGVAQQMFSLSDGSYLKLTVEKFYSPMGNTIQKVGISPDFKVSDNNLDSLKVAELLSGKCINANDKTGYLKVNINGSDFEIDLNIARDSSHWAAFQYIMNNVSKDNVYIGTNKGWIKAPDEYFNNVYQFLYSNYKALTTSSDAEKNKVFTVTFNKNIDINDLKNNSKLEIINVNTGERVAFDLTQVGTNKINLTPKSSLDSGQTYLIRVMGTVKSFSIK